MLIATLAVISFFIGILTTNKRIVLTFLISCIVLSVATLICLGDRTRGCITAKEIQLNASEQWSISDKTDKDWEWVLSEMIEANNIAEGADEGMSDLFWMLCDIEYAVLKIAHPDANFDYTVTIKDDIIIFPEDYDMLPLKR